MTAREHSKLLGIFFLIQSGLQLFAAAIIAVVYGGMGGMMLANARRSEEQTIGGIFLVLGIVIGIFILAFAALDFFAGWKLLKNKAGARILGIIASCLALLSFPLGTALGIYGLWFFFGEAGKNFETDAGVNANANHPPPPPNSWQ